jgi:hypothetical protein
MTTRTRVLILCTANSAQSQMAEGLLRHIDISRQRSKSVDEFIDPRPSAMGTWTGIGIFPHVHDGEALLTQARQVLTHIAETSGCRG